MDKNNEYDILLERQYLSNGENPYLNLKTLCINKSVDITTKMQNIKNIINKGVNINQKEENGMTLLMYIAENTSQFSCYGILHLLIKLGADINMKDNRGKTALMYASEFNEYSSNIETINLLINYNANVNEVDNKGMNALMYASKNIKSFSNENTVKVLLPLTDINHRCNNNKSYWDYLPNNYKDKYPKPNTSIIYNNHICHYNICIYCLENPTSILYTPCGHIISCFKCYSNDECKLCKTKIENKIMIENYSIV